MTYRNNRARRSRYRAVASWCQRIDIEALARVLLILALHRAEQKPGATRPTQAGKNGKPVDDGADGSARASDTQTGRIGGGS